MTMDQGETRASRRPSQPGARAAFSAAVSASLLLLLAAPATAAQQMYGTWHCRQFNAVMVLNPNATYTFRGPLGASVGQWGMRGNMLGLRDRAGRTITYVVRGFNATTLTLADQQGKLLVFSRVARRPSPGRATATGGRGGGGAGSGGSGKVLARKDGRVLTDGQIAVGVGIIQFIVDRRIKPSEIRELRRASVKEFNQSPATFMQGVAGLRRSLQTLRSLRDALKIGAARQMLLAAFHKNTSRIKKRDRPLMVRIINRYVKVVAYDAASGLALTDRDIGAALKYMQLSYQMAGQPFKTTAKMRAEFRKSTLQAFPGMPLAQKRFFCSASLAYKLVLANYARMSAARRAKLQAAYARKQQQAAYARPAASGRRASAGGSGIRFPPGWSSMTRAQKRAMLRKKMRSNTARQGMYRMMQNSALQQHATMLNTIENFGGTGNYWKVAPGY